VGQPGRVGELGDQQPADFGAQQVVQAAGQPRKTAVDLAQQLVLERAADLDPARPVGDQAGQLHHHGVRPGQRQAPASQQQIGDRGQVHRVGLHATLAVGPPLGGHLGRVELHQLPVARQHPRGGQRSMVVPGSLDPDPDQLHRPGGPDRLDPAHQLSNPSPADRELEPARQHLPGEVAHQRHRLVLANIHRHGHQPLGRHPTSLGHQSLHLGAMDMHHEHTTSRRCEGEPTLPLCTSGGGLRSPPIHISGALDVRVFLAA
jgi:hypothetical protein